MSTTEINSLLPITQADDDPPEEEGQLCRRAFQCHETWDSEPLHSAGP